jgi:hypothetical protein
MAIEDEIRSTRRSWNEVKSLAGDRITWKLFMDALCSTRSKGSDDEVATRVDCEVTCALALISYCSSIFITTATSGFHGWRLYHTINILHRGYYNKLLLL